MKSNILKKVIGAVAVMSLVAVSGMSAIAAGSPVVSDDGAIKIETGSAAATDKDGNVVGDVTISTTNKPDPTKQEQEAALGTTVSDDASVVTVEVTAPAGVTVDADHPLTVVIDVEGVVLGDTVYVLNYIDGQGWVKVEAKVVANGKVQCTFTHLSPVTFIVEKQKAAATPTTPTTTTAKATSKTSPKTGE
ncbi:MAG: hypothetical protein PHW34_10040 [Hespellia sp.]|nr:hypothetical protein [Hespellia sp.]